VRVKGDDEKAIVNEFIEYKYPDTIYFKSAVTEILQEYLEKYGLQLTTTQVLYDGENHYSSPHYDVSLKRVESPCDKRKKRKRNNSS
jgi:hypothetical protein